MAGFRDLIASQGYKSFMRKIFIYSLIVLIVGLISLWRHWSGANTMIIAGGGSLAIWFIFFIIEKIISNQDN